MKVKLLFLAAMLCAAMTATTATASSTAATANDAKISGRIKDANDKSAIIGATVLLMQDTVQVAGTTTDNNLNSPLTRTQEIRFWNITVR